MSKSFERILAMHCSPALLGIKSANLISCSLQEVPNLLEEIQELNQSYNPRIHFLVLKVEDHRVLILVYQNMKLSKTIFTDKNYEYLLSRGYPKNKELTAYLSRLKRRMENNDSFPHEIGVFLGYDLEDIIEFEKGEKECIYVGYWKVFSRKEEKIQIFNRFTRCRNIITNLLEKGYSLEAII